MPHHYGKAPEGHILAWQLAYGTQKNAYLVTMKKVFRYGLCILLLLASITLPAQDFQWARGIGSGLEDRSHSMSIDTAGNLYLTGIFSGTVDFDPGQGTFNLTSNGLTDVFVLKLTAGGQFVWAVSFGGPMNDAGNAIHVDSVGNVYLCGGFDGSVDFDPGAGTYPLSANGSTDIYVLKLDQNGGFSWAQAWGDAMVEFGNSIRTDASGNVLICGNFSGTVDFDPGAGVATYSSNGSTDIFVEKLDAAGNFIWARTLGNTSGDRANSIGVDAQGNVYTTGYFYGTVDFDPGPAVFPFVSAGSNDIFIQKLDASGAFIWAKAMGAALYDYGYCMEVDAAGNVYSTGFFGDMVDFDPGPSVSNLTSAGGDDIFVQKLDANGNFLWVTSFGGPLTDRAYSISVNALGQVYTTGYFSGTADFNPGPGVYTLSSQGGNDIFVHKLDASGHFLWAGAMGGTGDDKGYTVRSGAMGNIYSTGAFSATADFDPGASAFNLSSAGNLDVFIQNLNDCHNSYGTDVINACGTYTWINGLTYTNSNSTDTFTINSVLGCDSIITLNLTLQTISNLNVTANGATLLASNTNASYQWLDCNNNFAIIPGATTSTYVATSNGSYAVQLTENACIDTSACIAVNLLSTPERLMQLNMRCYPNPGSGHFFLELPQVLEPATLTVKNMLGQILFQQTYEQLEKSTLDLNEAPGLYVVELQTGTLRSHLKLMIR